MSLQTNNIYEFEDFRLDLSEKTLQRGENRIPLTPKVFETLCLLVENAGHLIEKDELMQKLWQDRFVEESNLTFNIKMLRKALGDNAQKPRFIETVPTRGYRFIAEVHIVEAEHGKNSQRDPDRKLVSAIDSTSPLLSFPSSHRVNPSGVVVALAEWRRDENEPEDSASVSPTEKLNEKSTKLELVPATQYANKRRNKNSYLLTGSLAAGVLLISIGSLAFWFTRAKGPEAGSPVLSASFNSEKLSTNGKVYHAVISADGKNVVYANGISGKQSIWLKQLESGNNVEIIPPSDEVYGGLAVAPDGNSFYFTRRRRNVEEAFTIYCISIFGGIPNKIADGVQGWISVSPDGEKVSFVRCYLPNNACSLWIAGTSGGEERKLASRPPPLRIGDNKFSPDGMSVAFAVGQSENASNEFGLAEVNIESGAERELTGEKFFDIKTLTWLPNQSGLLISALRNPEKTFRLWQVTSATGNSSPLTNDSENYSALSLDKTGEVIIATQDKIDSNLILYEDSKDKRILADATHVAFAPNGKIFFASLMSGNREIWSVNADGSEQFQLTNDPADDSVPVPSPDSKSIFFVSNRSGKAQVWRMNADGSNQTQLTEKEGGYPISVSPDGRWVYYHHGLQRTLWRVSKEGGETEQLVFDKAEYRFAFSPDGTRVGFSERQGGAKSIVIVRLADAGIVKTIKYTDEYADYGIGLELEWMPDGKSLAYVFADKELDNYSVWVQPTDGGKPKKIADLGDVPVTSLTHSPDGKFFAIIQGDVKHNAVLIKGLR